MTAVAVRKRVEQLKNEDQDFEWYPTTDEIIEAVSNHLKDNTPSSSYRRNVLDCGAGDGRVLKALAESRNRYAIEKARIHIKGYGTGIWLIGTDFARQTLIDKPMDVVFSNPPYSEYEEWSEKIIREASARYIYLVVPERWKESVRIKQAMTMRGVTAEVIGSYNFEDAERKARAKVDVIFISLTRKGAGDAFSAWFKENFRQTENKTDSFFKPRSTQDSVKNALEGQLVPGADKATVLEALYQEDLNGLLSNYKTLQTVDPELLEAIGVSWDEVMEALKLKIKGLKNLYWRELFDSFSVITDRLTYQNRQRMLERIMEHVNVDYSAENAYAIASWVAYNSSIHIDDQLIEVYERLIGQCNVQMYKSNQRTFRDEDWRYTRFPNNLEKFSLDHRIVAERMGGTVNTCWNWEKERYNGLSEHSYQNLEDLLVVCRNLGYVPVEAPMDFQWSPGKPNVFTAKSQRTGEVITLMRVRAFKKGNMHLQFSPEVMQKLNVEFGRLKGWIKSPKDAVSEMGVSPEEAIAAFNANFSLEGATAPSLLFVAE